MLVINIKLLNFSCTFIGIISLEWLFPSLTAEELVSKFNVGLKSLLHQCLSEPEFYGDFKYTNSKKMGKTDFSDQFRKNL